MTEHMVAIFDTEEAAVAAARGLESAGFPPQSIRRYRADSARSSRSSAEGAAGTAPSGGGFWGWLLGDEGDTTRAAYGQHEEWYDRNVSVGKTVLSVTVYEDSRIHEATTILESHHPIEIEENTAEDCETSVDSAHTTSSAPSAGTWGLPTGMATRRKQRPSPQPAPKRSFPSPRRISKSTSARSIVVPPAFAAMSWRPPSSARSRCTASA